MGDYWINCFLVGLMFEYNEQTYTRLCHRCIVCCFRRQSESERERTEKYLAGTFQPLPSNSNSDKKQKTAKKAEASVNNSGKSSTETEIVYDVAMADVAAKTYGKLKSDSTKSTLSPKQNTMSTFRSFAEHSTKPTSPEVASKLSTRRTSGTATALSSTCKTVSGKTRPGLVDRVTPYHAGLENSHGGLGKRNWL